MQRRGGFKFKDFLGPHGHRILTEDYVQTGLRGPGACSLCFGIVCFVVWFQKTGSEGYTYFLTPVENSLRFASWGAQFLG